MLFVATLKSRGLSARDTIACRMGWEYPEGIKVSGKYWPQNSDTAVVTIFEADSIEQIMPVTTAWNDAFEISVSPAIEAEDAMAAARERMS